MSANNMDYTPVIITDITDSKTTVDDIRQAYFNLRRLNKPKTQVKLSPMYYHLLIRHLYFENLCPPLFDPDAKVMLYGLRVVEDKELKDGDVRIE